MIAVTEQERKGEEKTGDREKKKKKREHPLRHCASEVSCTSYPQSRMNHSSQQSRAIRYVRLQENCPFVLKLKLCLRHRNTFFSMKVSYPKYIYRGVVCR